jgi:enolase-phosphatase E1
VKAAPLKLLQGLVWANGYPDGDLHGHVYEKVPAVMAEWNSAGLAQCIYSSGSVAAQRDWFAHTQYGDLTEYLAGYFNLSTVGRKKATASYSAISSAIGVCPEQTLFFSHFGEELDAAAAASWLTIEVRRDTDERGPVVPGHRTVHRLDAELVLPTA